MEIKVMADYESSPLWITAPPSDIGNLSLDEAPISSDLAADLQAWADAYDRTLNRADPRLSGFSTPELAQRFVEIGEGLAKRLAAELGDEYVVSYFDEEERTIRPISS